MEEILPNTKDFEDALDFIFRFKTISEHADYVEIQSGDLHKILGGYPNNGNHRMAACCSAMRNKMNDKDLILNESNSGKSTKLLIRYYLPRSEF